MMKNHAVFFRKFGTIVGYTLLFIVISSLLYIASGKLFSITAVIVDAKNIDVVVNAKRMPQSLLFFPSAKIRAELLSENPMLADIQFTKQYPHTLIIRPILRTPAAVVIGVDRRVLISDHGVVLSDDSGTTSLPTIQAPIISIRMGQTMTDQGVVASLTFLRDVEGVAAIQSMTVDADGTIHAVSPGEEILFTQNENIARVVSTLQTLLAGFRIKGTLPAVIDLRFDKPVIR